ncbi:MAG TPA: membrane protein insertion efficiency factor YidD [Malonomonas sp.]
MKLILPTLLLVVSLCGSVSAEQWGPWEAPATQRQQPATNNGPLQQAVRLFQKYVSPVDGPRCPMYPTCSTYSLQALHKHGALLGTFITVDRLYREVDAQKNFQPIAKWGWLRFHDPLTANDFWLNRAQ